MKNKKEKKEFDAVEYMRQIRKKISAEILNLTHEQIIEYFKISKTAERILPRT